MQFVIIGILCVFAFLALTGLAQGTPIGARFASALDQARLRGAGLLQAMIDAYEEYVQPVLRRMGYVVLATLVFGFVAAWIVLGRGILNWFTFVLVGTMVAGIYLILRDMSRQPVDFSVFALAQSIFVALLGEGAALFLLAHATWNRQTALLGIVFILMAREVLFLIIQIAARLATLGVDMAEGTSNLLLNLVVKLLTVGTQGLKDVFGAGGVNIADQERFVPAIRRAKLKINSLLLPVLAMGLLMPYFVVLFALILAGMVSSLNWGKLESVDIDTKSRRQRSALAFEFLSYLLLLPALALTAIPALQAKMNTGYGQFEIWLVDSAKPERIFLLFLAVAAGAAAYSWAALGSRFMRILAGVAAIVCLGSFGDLIWSFVSDDATNIAKAATNGVLMEFTPTCTATKDGVAIKWPEYPGNKGYQIMRRELHDTGFKPLTDSSGAPFTFDRDAKQWEDTTPERGKTYFYRVVALGASHDGSNLTSEERRVEVRLPDPPSKPAVTATSPRTTYANRGQPAQPSGCVGTSCGVNPALAELCRRYPASCAGP
ncbi:MAG: hypothetical protein ABIB04_00395 [Patescibacteria group bacterium]